MLELLHRIAALPWVYDIIQFAFGGGIIYRKVRKILQNYANPTSIIDIGGGTGIALRHVIQPILPKSRYFCLDIDPLKLSELWQTAPAAVGIIGDAARLPIASQQFDCVIMMAVTHHIQDEEIEGIFRECIRVLRRDGIFIFLDAVENPQRFQSRLMWSLDRGSYPKTAAKLRTYLTSAGEIIYTEEFAIVHQYALYVVKRVAQP
jgi:ubiquinone/menaquinone biosynthesis C-methylase UbiE